MIIVDQRDKMFFYDRFAASFDDKMNMYDLRRRIEVVFNDFLKDELLTDKLFLDAGSGTGWFSSEAVQKKARVYSLDVGENILAEVAKKCNSNRIVGSILEIPFDDNYFDIVLCTEVIEHTPDPKIAVAELARVVKKGGILIITVPNIIWHPAITIANFLKLRPYEGYENWVGWNDIKKWLTERGFRIESMKGVHLFPFSLSFTHNILRYFDNYESHLRYIMLNICVKAIKE